MKKLIADIPKNGREVIRIALDEFEGRQIVGIRVWFRSGDELRPTSKGLSVAIKHLPAIRAAIDKAESDARAAGILE